MEDLGGNDALSHVRIVWLPLYVLHEISQWIKELFGCGRHTTMIRHIIQLVDSELILTRDKPYATTNVLRAVR